MNTIIVNTLDFVQEKLLMPCKMENVANISFSHLQPNDEMFMMKEKIDLL